jgi:hypothetical protein
MDASSDRGIARVWPYQVVAVSAGTFLTIVSVQVALARRARRIGAIVFAVVALLAMTGVAYASLQLSARPDGLPADITLYVLRVAASLYAVVLLATTTAALLLARRSPLPPAPVHWGMTAAAGLLMYSLSYKGPFQVDIMNAVQDGPSPGTVMHPTPEERLARARSLPDCAIGAAALTAGWHWQAVKPAAARLPMPTEMREQPDEVPDDPEIQRWGLERWGDIVLQLDGEAQQSTGFFIGGGAGTETEPPCALRVGPSVVPISRTASVVRRRGASSADSMFTATTDIPIALPDTQLGVGITARTRAGRDTLLSILAAMQVVGREQRR